MLNRNSYFLIVLVVLIFILGIFSILFLTKSSSKEILHTKAQVIPSLIQPTIAPTLTPTSTKTPLFSNNPGTVLKNYVSRDYGFSIDYPSDWQLLEEPNVFGIEIQKVNRQGLGFSISIRVLENPNNLSLDVFSKAQAYPFPDGSLENPEKVKIGKLVGYKLNHLPQGLLLSLYVPYKQGVINIFAGGDIDLNNFNNKVFYTNLIAQIINTFKYKP